MAIEDIGPLTAADEFLYHQIPDTFAVTATSDRAWTEKIWLSLYAKDGSLQVDFGLGKYTNRNVIDGFGGVSRGREQWTVRGSRELAPNPLEMAIGPLRYEVVEPLRRMRCVLEENDVQPIAFDLTLTGALPPFFEARNRHRENYRIDDDVVRYHQSGTVSGWVLVDGERVEVTDATWGGARDHSWGERGERLVGGRAPGVKPAPMTRGGKMMALWAPFLLTRPDGSQYEIMFFRIDGAYQYFSGHVNHPDGRQEPIARMTPNLRLGQDTRYLAGGHHVLELASGERRVLELEPLGETGFHLRTAGYGSWKGWTHGHWRGELDLDGEYIPDCTGLLSELGQFRDKPTRVRDGDAVGYGIHETILTGDWSAEYGVGPETDWESIPGETKELEEATA